MLISKSLIIVISFTPWGFCTYTSFISIYYISKKHGRIFNLCHAVLQKFYCLKQRREESFWKSIAVQANKLLTDTNATHSRTNIFGKPCFQTPKVRSPNRTCRCIITPAYLLVKLTFGPTRTTIWGVYWGILGYEDEHLG